MAAFSLGAIQALQTQLGLLKGPKRARFLAAVSGGSYTAAAYSLAAGGILDTPSIRITHTDLRRRAAQMASEHTDDERPISPDGHPFWTDDADIDQNTEGPWRRYLKALRRGRSSRRNEERLIEQLKLSGWKSESPSDALMPGTPESEYIRNHARYMAEPSGLVATGISFLFRILLNVTLIVGTVTSVGAIFGAINRAVGFQRFNTKIQTFYFSGSDRNGLVWHAIVPYMTILVGYNLVLLWSIAQRRRTEMRRKVATELTAQDIHRREMLQLAWCALVLFIACQFLPQLIYKFRFEHALDVRPSNLIPISLASLGSAGSLSALLISMLRSRFIAMPYALAKRSTRLVDFTKAVVFRMLQLAVAISLPLALLLAFMGGWLIGAAGTWNLGTFWLVYVGGTAAYILVLGKLYGGYHNITPFTLYRDKLSHCFDLIRQFKDEGKAHRARQRIETPPLFALRDLDTPELLICASANLSEEGTTPAGAFARPIVFSPSNIYMPNVYGATFDTKTLDRAIRAQYNTIARFASIYDGTIMTCVAVTGAAISPSMGKFTRSWLRGLMGFLNLRLGIWMPNPANPNIRDSITRHGKAPKIVPSTRYFIRELRGRHYLNSDLIYVSDGGHYENLGLVELVRRGCNEIWCIDGSGDRPGTAVALAESLTLITSELGLSVDFDLGEFGVSAEASTEKNYPKINRVFLKGIIRSLRPTEDGSYYECVVRVIKIGLDSETSSRINELRHKYRRFPYDSTMNQLYNAERFDMYRDLGFDSVSRAINERRNEVRQPSVAEAGDGAPHDDGIALIGENAPPNVRSTV